MALTANQRNKLPASAFVYHSGPRSNWRYPVPTRGQASKAGISEKQRQTMLGAAKAYSGRGNTRGTKGRVSSVANKRK
jgi:hypothetical protein